MTALWGGLAAIACRAAPPPGSQVPVAMSKPPVALSIPEVAQEPPETAPGPPRWVLLPKSSHWAPAFQRSTDVGTLHAGAGNERWLLEGEIARGAGPDPVVLAGVLPNAAGFTFITREGEVYEASSALGDLSLAVSVSKPYVDAAAGRDHFVAIDEARTLQRSADRGRTWQPVGATRHQGELLDVVMLETGAGLLLANRADRSELFSTRDDGATWHKVYSQGQPFTGLVSVGAELQPVVRVNRQHQSYLYATLDTVPIERVSLSRQGATVMVGVPTPYPVIEGSDPWDPNGVATAPRPLLFRSNDGGRHFGEVALPSAFRALALAGRRGFGIDHDAVAFETDDFGTNWSRVPAPVGAGHGAIECNDSGCITRRGLRVGWER